MRGDVLHPGIIQRLVVRHVLDVAHQGAATAFGVVVLVCRKTVVDHDHHAALHTVRQRVHKGNLLLVCLGQIVRLAGAQSLAPVGGHG